MLQHIGPNLRFWVRGASNGGNGADAYTKLKTLDGKWHHVAGVHDGVHKRLMLYLDGVLRAQVPITESSTYGGNGWFIGSRDANVGGIEGDLDDAIVWRRALTPAEIATYYHSKAPYGSTFAPGAQADFDDVRVTETTPLQKEHGTHFEVVGARPHSDTGLAGVVAYWKLDGDARDVLGKHNGKVLGVVTGSRGRFGDPNGALDTTAASITVAGAMALLPPVGAWEAWVRPDVCTSGHILNMDGQTSGVTFISVENGCILRAYLAEGSGGADLRSKIGVAPGTWHHVALRWDLSTVHFLVDGLEVAKGKRPGYFGKTLKMLRISGSSTGSAPFRGALDEVLIHNVAKSADYFAKRARGLPRVRFLAHTAPAKNQAGTFDFYGYTLRWGNPAAEAVATKVVGLDKKTACDALLSPCLGYAGWWRMQDPPDQGLLDSAAYRLHGAYSGPTVTVASPAGVGVTFDGKTTHADVPHAGPLMLGKAFTVEALATVRKSLGGLAQIAGKSEHNKLPRWALGAADANTHFYGNGSSKYVEAGTAGKSLVGAGWNAIAGVRDGDSVRLFHNSTLAGTKTVANLPTFDNPAVALHIGWYGVPGATNGRFLNGDLAGVRLMRRALAADEQLHFPAASWAMKATVPRAPPAIDVSDVVGRIVFNTNGNAIWTARPDGSDAKKILSGVVGSLDFSADGRSVLYIRNGAIRSVGVDGTGDKLLRAGGYATLHVGRHGGILATVGGGTTIDRLSADGKTRLGTITGPQNTNAPVWSPDGKRAAWCHRKFGCARTIRIGDPNGGNAFNTGVALADWGQLSWSPDGEYIAFATAKYGSCNPSRPSEWKIYVVEARAGAKAVQVTKGPGNHRDPDWLDNEHIYFTSDADGDRDIYLTDLAGTVTRRITNLPGHENAVRFYGVRLPDKLVKLGKVLTPGAPGGPTGAGLISAGSIRRGSDNLLRLWMGEGQGASVRWAEVAESDEGRTWKKRSDNPLFKSGQWGSPQVARGPDGGYRMWVETGGWTHWLTMTSKDGQSWSAGTKFATDPAFWIAFERGVGGVYHGWRWTASKKSIVHQVSNDGIHFGAAQATNIRSLGLRGPLDVRWVVDRFVGIGLLPDGTHGTAGWAWMISEDGTTWTRGATFLEPGPAGSSDWVLGSRAALHLERRVVGLVYPSASKYPTDGNHILNYALDPASACKAKGGIWFAKNDGTADFGCWFKAGHMQSCTAACKARGLSCDPGPWNGDKECRLHKHWSSCNYGCTPTIKGKSPYSFVISTPGVGDHPVSPQKYCVYRGPGSPPQQCDAANPIGDGTWPGRFRLCVCE